MRLDNDWRLNTSKGAKTKERTYIVLALGKLGAWVSLPSIDLDACLRLKILRRHSIGNKERQAEQSSCLCRCTRTKINYIWNVLVSRLAAMIGVSTVIEVGGFYDLALR